MKNLKNYKLLYLLAVAAVILTGAAVYGHVTHSAGVTHLAYLLGALTFGAYTYGPQSQIMSAQEAQGKNTNSIMAGWVDRGPWQYWDTITGDPNVALAQTYSPFSVPIGQQNPLPGPVTKTKLQTNMVRGNQFPPPRCLLLIQIGFYFSSTMLKPDIDAFLDGCWMEFRIDDKIFHEGQPWQFPGGAGLTGVTTQTGESVYTLGLPAPVYTRRYDAWSKYIAPLQQFSMAINFPTPPTMSANGPGLYLVVFLDGLTDRSVQ
jgi:hypothetical protein